MSRYLLDTNMVSFLLRGQPQVTRRVVEAPMSALCISAITEGELLFGLARRPQATQLHKAVHALLLRVDVLPWDRAAAGRYGRMRADQESAGRSLGALDGLIAAHALAVGAVLVSNDQAFAQVSALVVEDWSR